MKTCMNCGREMKEGENFVLPYLTVRTLPVRDLGGEHKVQALGDFTEFAVCRSCASEHLKKEQTGGTSQKRLLGFLLVLLAGICVIPAALLLAGGAPVYLMPGIFAVFAGTAGLVSTVRDSRSRRTELASMGTEEALLSSARALALTSAPRKQGDEDLSYIPAEKALLPAKKGDLMVLYDLLPEIALEAWKQIEARPE